MTSEEQRIAIAEACGWSFVENPVTHIGGYWEKGTQGVAGYERGDWGSRECLVGLPDYLSDLNAMHEAEKVLTLQQLRQMTVEIHDIMMRDPRQDWIPVCHATAAQRAEAFLRTLGKWKE